MSLINNREYNWSDIRVHMLGNTKPLVGITEISWSTEASNEYHHGIGKMPVAFTKGAKKFSGSMKFHKGELDSLRLALPPNSDLYDIEPFAIVVSFQAGLKISTCILEGVILTKDDQSNTNGTSILEGNLSFIFSGIKNQ